MFIYSRSNLTNVVRHFDTKSIDTCKYTLSYQAIFHADHNERERSRRSAVSMDENSNDQRNRLHYD